MGRRKKEIWKPLIDLKVKPIYFISSYGRVRNLKDKFLKPSKDKDGYLKYTLQGKNGKKVKKLAHVLVATHFVENDSPNIKTQVNHKDFRKNNNYYKNLEWITNKENIEHAVKHKRQIALTCEAHGMSTMTNEEVKRICELLQEGYKIKDILFTLGYSKKSNNHEYEKMRGKIKHIKSRKTWKSISKDYNF